MVAVPVTLTVQPKRAGGRGRACVLERVAGVARTPTRDGVMVLQVRSMTTMRSTGASTTC
ncbi:integrase family protein [Burkholderia contaminans]|uniref:Integrase family protein n=1 Tax=Burkholderia contaminans TaxID=488447 RepID=A0A6P3C9L6_9BURK|nr:integrase family protein [Burkholderia contaminans]